MSHNLFCGNSQNTAFRRGWHDKKLSSLEDVDYFEATDNRTISLDVFVDPARLDFRFKTGKRPKGFPEIPFDQIGLQVGPYRTEVPNKNAYRRALKAKWAHRRSYDATAVYDPGTVSELLYFNTGKLVFSELSSR